MTTTPDFVNAGTLGGIAQIRNVQVCYEAIARTQKRHEYLPGLSVFYGPSGYGKSMAANHMAVRCRAFYLQAKSTWTKKHFLEMLLREMSLAPAATVSRMVDQAAAELAKSGRPLIVDEFDHMVTDAKVELVRDIYESSQGTVLLIGEEMLPKKLERWERFHGRVLHWMPAMPTDLQDARLLVPVYSPRVAVGDDVLEALIQAVRGSTRRVANNLQVVQQKCLEAGLPSVDLGAWKKLQPGGFITGESPKPRVY